MDWVSPLWGLMVEAWWICGGRAAKWLLGGTGRVIRLAFAWVNGYCFVPEAQALDKLTQ
jgi:hypothetical protein